MSILGIVASSKIGGTVPSAPTIGTVTVTNNTTVSIPFTAGADGGRTITSYTATSSPSITLSTSGTSSPLTVTGTFVLGTSYTFTIKAKNGIGESPASGTSNSVIPKNYSVGDTGPGGGIVFYDAGSTLSWGRYLEAAVSASSPSWTDATYVWSGNTNTLVGTSTAIGTGLANTNAIVAQNNTASRAATICRAYSGGGKSDWFLPSKDELNQLYAQKTTVGGFANDFYWSSSEDSATHAWTQSFSATTSQFGANKGNSYYVRPIRAF
jgi:hypothetical protein